MLGSAVTVVRTLVETPADHQCDEHAYKLLLQDLGPREGVTSLFDGKCERLADAATRLQANGFEVTFDMLALACGLIGGTVERKPKGRAKVRHSPVTLQPLILTHWLDAADGR